MLINNGTGLGSAQVEVISRLLRLLLWLGDLRSSKGGARRQIDLRLGNLLLQGVRLRCKLR